MWKSRYKKKYPARREKISKIYRKFGTYLDNMTFQ